jgi:hypothetical protein
MISLSYCVLNNNENEVNRREKEKREKFGGNEDAAAKMKWSGFNTKRSRLRQWIDCRRRVQERKIR